MNVKAWIGVLRWYQVQVRFASNEYLCPTHIRMLLETCTKFCRSYSDPLRVLILSSSLWPREYSCKYYALLRNHVMRVSF